MSPMAYCMMIFIILLYLSPRINCLDNKLALTPPMGWIHWGRFQCTTNCKLYPNECISDKLFRSMADHMVSDGYLKAGYEYLIIDDCWSAKNRDKDGKLQPDPERFPYGMKNLSNYIHSKGLKFGLYTSYGQFTCAKYPGSASHLELDANTFAEWGVDYLKVDACYADSKTFEKGYKEMGDYLNVTGRPIIYSCSWPMYQEVNKINPSYTNATKICNLWRNYYDVFDSWYSITKIMDWYGKHQDRIAKYSGPGHWNDPDMLIIGNYGLNIQQSKAQMAIWCIMAAPLIMSVDLKTIDKEFRNILLNKEAIAINQDTLGLMGRLALTKNKIQIWIKRQKFPSDVQSYAIGLVSYREEGFPYMFAFKLKELKIRNPGGFWLTNVFDKGQIPGNVTDSQWIYLRIKPTEGILLVVNAYKRMKSCHLNRE